MKERPILFSGDMVRAILGGRKSQTRRVMKPQPDDDGIVEMGQIGNTRGIAYIRGARGGQCERVPCPYGVVGDHLWVREAHYVWNAGYQDGSGRRIDYRATEPDAPCGRWTPSIHMPRWASRLTLAITDVRVERLHEISEEDAKSEGVRQSWAELQWRAGTWRQGFINVWDSLNAKRGFGWDANPYVWCISFRRLP